MPRFRVNRGKTVKSPARPFEKERLDQELQLIGKYGLKNKREVWRAKTVVSKLRNYARELLTLDEKDPRRLFDGAGILRRLTRLGILDETRQNLDFVLSISTENFLDRRLQTLVYRAGLAYSIHHARILIRGRHIRVGKQVVDIPSFLVRTDAQKHIGLVANSAYAGGPHGRTKRRNLKRKAEGGGAAADDE